jgi:hypothetical protein
MFNKYEPLMTALENVYGKASAAGFGSAVFHEAVAATTPTDAFALKHYQAFLGPKWDAAASESPWMIAWRPVYQRQDDGKRDILTELAGISDHEAKTSVTLLTELIENADAGRQAISQAFNHEDVSKLFVFTVGDGEAMSGIMVSAFYTDGYACSLIVLMD